MHIVNCPDCGKPLLLLTTPLATSMSGTRVTLTQDAMLVHESTRLPHCDLTQRVIGDRLVTDVKWNGEAAWVESEPVSGKGRRVWNELDCWVEATVLVEPAPGEA